VPYRTLEYVTLVHAPWALTSLLLGYMLTLVHGGAYCTTHYCISTLNLHHTSTRSHYVLKVWDKRSKNLYNVAEVQQKPART